MAQVTVPLPDREGRAAILAVHLRGTPLPAATDRVALCADVARVTRGTSSLFSSHPLILKGTLLPAATDRVVLHADFVLGARGLRPPPSFPPRARAFHTPNCKAGHLFWSPQTVWPCALMWSLSPGIPLHPLCYEPPKHTGASVSSRH